MAITKAIDDCNADNILKEFLIERKGEVLAEELEESVRVIQDIITKINNQERTQNA